LSTRRPAQKRPFFTPKDLEALARHSLTVADLYPSSPGPVRIERFVEKHFGVVVEYDELPASVMGYTRFAEGRVDGIVIARALDADPSRVAERRVRTTLAHEAGHGLLHAPMFAHAFEPTLFANSEDVSTDQILCRDEGPAIRNERWWEVQANMMMGPLLLPADLSREVIRAHMIESGLGALQLPLNRRHRAYLDLADVFDVNPIVADIRLQGLCPIQDEAQLTL
jgi:hypothetical protein